MEPEFKLSVPTFPESHNYKSSCLVNTVVTIYFTVVTK